MRRTLPMGNGKANRLTKWIEYVAHGIGGGRRQAILLQFKLYAIARVSCNLSVILVLEVPIGSEPERAGLKKEDFSLKLVGKPISIAAQRQVIRRSDKFPSYPNSGLGTHLFQKLRFVRSRTVESPV